jgi:hypothetical protein
VILLGLKHDQGPLRFVSKLLLLRKFLNVLALHILELRTVYRDTRAYANKQIKKIITVHQSIKIEHNNPKKLLFMLQGSHERKNR